ncbi:unnamed protein product [Phytomonas sp. EM1]|nr:unnamed protein product [Phytomonas sp. EM1]|eukprot:CCW65046.1 unnamed protein product [Phytomonas sp. isolate EM1]
MWAIMRRPILHGETCQQLEGRRRLCDFQSNMWLLPSHLHVLKLKMRTQNSKLVLPAEHFVEAPPRAFPLPQVPPGLMSTIVERVSPPTASEHLPMILDTKDPGVYFWRLSTMDEFLDASFLWCEMCFPRNWLLCSSNVIAWPQSPLQPLTILNAQETTNPFLLDPLLEHVNLVDGKPLSKSLSSGLTTVAAQFGYLSFAWLEACNASPDVRSRATPHSVLVLERMCLLHISQLSIETQRKLMMSASRFVLLRSAISSFVYITHEGWVSESRLRLTEKIERSDIPPLAEGSPRQPLLWVADNAGDDMDESDKYLVRYRCSQRLFFNVSQLTTKKALIS